MSFNLGSPPAPVLPAAPAPPPMLGPIQPGQKPQAKASQPTALGSMFAATSGQTGQKTLLGQ